MYMYYPKTMGFPGGLVVKNQPANAVDTDSIPGSFYIYIYTYIYTHTHTHTHTYIFILDASPLLVSPCILLGVLQFQILCLCFCLF